jgi:hypothetical protein
VISEEGQPGLGLVRSSPRLGHILPDGVRAGRIGGLAVAVAEKLCPQYMLRTDEMEYHIRPTDLKHEVLLPVGQEIEFKIKKNRMFVKALDGDRKARSYSIVAMKPTNPEGESQSSSVNPSRP